MTPTAGRSRSAVNRAYDGLKTAIVAGDVVAGQHLREEVWAKQLHTSRTPIREAFRRLGAEGWLEIKPDQGVRVAQWSASDIDEVFEIRALIESHATRRAATRVTPDQLRELRKLATHMAELDVRPIDDIVAERTRINKEFHDLIAQAAASGRLQRILRMMVELPFVKWTFNHYTARETARSAAHHFEIIAALEARDPEWAASTMCSHILSARRAMLRQVAAHVDVTAGHAQASEPLAGD